jgi:hypothetical protein
MIGLAEGVATAVRRRQREREPRVLLFDRSGEPSIVAPSALGYDELLEVAERLLRGVVGEPAGAERRASRFSTRRARSSDESE